MPENMTISKTASELQRGDVVRVNAGWLRTYETSSPYDDGETRNVRAFDHDELVDLQVRGAYLDPHALVWNVSFGTGQGHGENVGFVNVSSNDTFDVVEPEPGDYTVVDVAIVEPDRETMTDDDLGLTLSVATAIGRTFTITIDVDDMAAMLFDFDVAGVDTNGEPIAEPDLGCVVSLLAAVSREVEA